MTTNNHFEGNLGPDGYPIDPKVLEEAERRVAGSSLKDATTSPGAAAESGKVFSVNPEPTFVTGAQMNAADEMIKDPKLRDAELF